MHRTGQFLDAQRRCITLLEPLDGANDAMGAALALGQVNQTMRKFAAQHAVIDFPLHQWSQHGGILRGVEQSHHSKDGVQQDLVHARDEQPAIGGGERRSVLTELQQQTRDLLQIEVQTQAEVWALGAGFEHLSHRGQCYRHDEVIQSVVVEHLAVQHRALATLHHDGQTGLIDRRHTHRRHAGANQREPRQRRLMRAVERGQSGNPRRQLLLPFVDGLKFVGPV